MGLLSNRAATIYQGQGAGVLKLTTTTTTCTTGTTRNAYTRVTRGLPEIGKLRPAITVLLEKREFSRRNVYPVISGIAVIGLWRSGARQNGCTISPVVSAAPLPQLGQWLSRTDDPADIGNGPISKAQQ